MSVPVDFEAYWQTLRDEVAAIETEWDRVERTQLVTSRSKSWRIDWIRFSSVNDIVIEGWLSVPFDHPVIGAGFLWLPGYSYGTPPPDDSNLLAGTVTLAINVHGNQPDAPYVNPAGKSDYILEGIRSPRDYIYRKISGHCLKALDVLLEQEEITHGVGVGGMSQGGGLALIVAAQSQKPKICCADMPFLADIERSLSISRSPAYKTLKEHLTAHPDDLATMLLFDAVLHAPLIDVPTWLSSGGKDPACKPETVESVYEALPTSEKQYVYFPQAGHVFLPEMNAKYQSMVEKYLLQTL
jgi:cephalosporin-C deacetylase